MFLIYSLMFLYMFAFQFSHFVHTLDELIRYFKLLTYVSTYFFQLHWSTVILDIIDFCSYFSKYLTFWKYLLDCVGFVTAWYESFTICLLIVDAFLFCVCCLSRTWYWIVLTRFISFHVYHFSHVKEGFISAYLYFHYVVLHWNLLQQLQDIYILYFYIPVYMNKYYYLLNQELVNYWRQMEATRDVPF